MALDELMNARVLLLQSHYKHIPRNFKRNYALQKRYHHMRTRFKCFECSCINQLRVDLTIFGLYDCMQCDVYESKNVYDNKNAYRRSSY